MARRKRLQVGEVFTIPLDDERVGYGQIVSAQGQGHYYFAVFEGAYPREQTPDLDAVLEGGLALLALSLDALLYHDHWQIVAERPVNSAMPWPAYKEGVSPPGTFEVVDHTGERRRKATQAEAEMLPFRAVVAPIRVEKALRALHGLEDWDDAYDELRPIPASRTVDALLSGP